MYKIWSMFMPPDDCGCCPLCCVSVAVSVLYVCCLFVVFVCFLSWSLLIRESEQLKKHHLWPCQKVCHALFSLLDNTCTGIFY